MTPVVVRIRLVLVEQSNETYFRYRIRTETFVLMCTAHNDNRTCIYGVTRRESLPKSCETNAARVRIAVLPATNYIFENITLCIKG